MRRSSSYWVGTRPSGGDRWAYTTCGTVIVDSEIKEAIFRMQRRYAKQWNDIELDRSRSLSEHTHEILGAQKVGGGGRKFILHAQEDNKNHWILEIFYARGFSEFHPGASCGMNPFRSTDDIRSVHLHWSDDGRSTFEKWLLDEGAANQHKGEAEEYIFKASKIKHCT
jgi:hypothetical protein